MRIQASQHNMKAETLSESFILQLQLEGVPANNLAKKPAVTVEKTFTARNLPAEVYYIQNDEGDTQLHLSIILEKYHVTALLISIAPNSSYLDIANDERLTALHYAVIAGQCKIARKLVLAGANTQARTNEGYTALHLAVMERQLECVKALTDPLSSSEKESLAKSNVPRTPPQVSLHIDARNYIGQTALHIAALKNDVQLVHQLLLVGADVNAKEGLGGRTALHMAIEKDNAEVVHYLAQIPTTLSATMYGGETAYQVAVECSPHYVEALLCYGASPVNRTKDDDTMSEDSSNDGDYDDPSYKEYNNNNDSYSNMNAQLVTV